MATQVGNTTEMYGHKYNIVVTNICGKDLMSSSDLAARSLIVSSQANANKEDLGITSLFMTDKDGKPIRLTYTIGLGNGLVHGKENEEDVIRLAIDNSTICTDYVDEALYVNKGNLIDNNTLDLNIVSTPDGPDKRITVNTRNLEPATNIYMGIVKADENTTYIDPTIPGTISVNTQRLDTVDDATNRDGIVKHNSQLWSTITAEDGRLDVITANLDKASASSPGIVQSDDDTIFVDESGIMRVVTENLDEATESRKGIVRADNHTISIENGIMTVETANLAHATMESFGIIRPSQWCFDINSYDCLEVKRYADLERLMEENWPEHEEMWKDITDLKNRVSKLETMSVFETIEVFEPAGTLSTILKYPERDEDGNTIEYKDKRTVPFKIKSNCKFNAKVDWVNNENPQIKLLYVKYKDSIIVNESELYNTIFDPGENINDVLTIEFTFEICNYNRDNNISGINTNAVISVASINNSAVKQTAHHTFTRWNNMAWIDEEKITIAPPPPVEEDIPIETEEKIETITTTRIFVESSEKLGIYSGTDSTINSDILFNTTGSKKFYITGTVNYSDVSSDGTSIDGQMNLSLSESTENNKYPIYKAWVDEEYVNGQWVDKGHTLFNEPKIISTFATTGKNNVLSVSSKNNISTNKRRQRIAIAFNSVALAQAALNDSISSVNINTVTPENVNISAKIQDKVPTDLYRRISARLTPVRPLHQAPRLVSTTTRIVSADLVQRSEKLEREQRLIEQNVDRVCEIYDDVYSVYKRNIVNTDIKRERRQLLEEEFETKIIDITDKFINTVDKIDKTIDKSTVNKSNYVVVLEYIENPKFVEKQTLDVKAEVVGGAPYIKFTVTRSKNSILDGSNKWSVDITYRYINSNGLELNPETTEQPIITIEGNNTEYSKVLYIPPAEITKIMNWLKTNTVSSIVIKKVEHYGFVSTDDYKLETTSSVSGTWPLATVPAIPKEEIISFGNAKIVSITSIPWDDSALILGFTIQGGSTTNIPDDTQISEMVNSSNGKTNFIFTIKGNTYNSSDIYWGSTAEANGYCKFGNYDVATDTFYPWTDTKGKVYWKNNQCTVYFKLYTNYQQGRSGNYNLERKFYLKEYGYQKYFNRLVTVYLEDRLFKGEQNILNFQQRDYMCVNVPLVTEINAIRFWFGLIIGPTPYQSSPNVKDKFESSSSSLSEKVFVNFNFAIKCSQAVSFVNASTAASR